MSWGNTASGPSKASTGAARQIAPSRLGADPTESRRAGDARTKRLGREATTNLKLTTLSSKRVADRRAHYPGRTACRCLGAAAVPNTAPDRLG